MLLDKPCSILYLQDWRVAADKALQAGIDITDGVSAVLFSLKQGGGVPG